MSFYFLLHISINGADIYIYIKDEWDNFMQGINLDTSQSAAWPVMAGITNTPQTMLNADGSYRAPAGAGVGSGENQKQDSGYFITEGMDIGSLLR
jgi:hypothetical protein